VAGLTAAEKTPDLDPTAAATPCGLIAKSLFNDTFKIVYSETGDDFKSTDGGMTVSHTDIAWASDVTYKFKNTPKPWDGKQWWNMEHEHFIVWMRTAGLPNFRKLWGSMTNVKKGYYQI